MLWILLPNTLLFLNGMLSAHCSVNIKILRFLSNLFTLILAMNIFFEFKRAEVNKLLWSLLIVEACFIHKTYIKHMSSICSFIPLVILYVEVVLHHP